MIRQVLRMGDPRLLRVAEPVARVPGAELDALVADMLDTMRDLDGAGLAAPQIGVGLRVVVFEVDRNPRSPLVEPVPLTILVNPQITPIGDDIVEDWEGCLSVPGLRGLVPRHDHIRYTGLAPDGSPVDRTVRGFHARVVQHECDHLDGILYPARIVDMSSFGFEPEIARLRAAP